MSSSLFYDKLQGHRSRKGTSWDWVRRDCKDYYPRKIKQRLAIWLLLLATSNLRIKIGGCWSRYGIGIEHPETILWDLYPLAYRSLLKRLQVDGSSFSLKKKESSTMYLFLRKASTSPSLKPKCGYLFTGQCAMWFIFKIQNKYIVYRLIQNNILFIIWYKRVKLMKSYFEMICSIKISFQER